MEYTKSNINKVLFIGNSHTYFECLPFLFVDVCKQGDIDVHAGMSTYPGCDWNWHMSSPNTLPNLRLGGYRHIVIQQKAHPFNGIENLIEQGKPLIHEIKAANAIPVLFVVWSEKDNPEGQQVIDDAHDKLAKLCGGCLVARCGTAWHTLREQLDLYSPDGGHMNSRGAYLNACMLAKTIYNIDPLALPGKIKTKALTKDLTEDEIRLLQQTAALV